MGILAYFPFLLVFAVFSSAFVLTRLGREIPVYLDFDVLYGIPFLLIWCSFLLWVILTTRLDRKQKLFWIPALLVANIVAIPWFYHHMRRVYMGTLHVYSDRIERLADAFLEHHHSDRSLLNNPQWQTLLSQLKKKQYSKMGLLCSFLGMLPLIIAALYGYMTFLQIKETHLLAFPFVDIEMWNTLESAQRYKFIFLDFLMVCSIGLMLSAGFFYGIAACANYLQSGKHLNNLSVFLPSTKPQHTDEHAADE